MESNMESNIESNMESNIEPNIKPISNPTTPKTHFAQQSVNGNEHRNAKPGKICLDGQRRLGWWW